MFLPPQNVLHTLLVRYRHLSIPAYNDDNSFRREYSDYRFGNNNQKEERKVSEIWKKKKWTGRHVFLLSPKGIKPLGSHGFCGVG